MTIANFPFRVRFVFSKGKVVTYDDAAAPSLTTALKIAEKNFRRGAASALVEERINGHWTLRARRNAGGKIEVFTQGE